MYFKSNGYISFLFLFGQGGERCVQKNLEKTFFRIFTNVYLSAKAKFWSSDYKTSHKMINRLIVTNLYD